MKKIRSGRAFIFFLLIFAFIFPDASLYAQRPLPIDILSCTIIDTPGNYRLVNNITGKDVPACIEITSGNVSLNGRGFSVSGAAATVGIKVYNPGGKLGDVTIENVNLNDWVTGIEFQNVNNSSILNSNLQNINDTGIKLISSSGNNVSGNTVTSDSNYGTFVGISNNGSDNRIEHNTVSASAINGGNSFSSGIAVSSPGTGNMINGNNISNVYTGITVGGSSHTISNNTLVNNIYGMRISFTDLTISNNTISSIYNGDGIWTNYLTNSTITGNKITGSAYYPNEEVTGIRMLCSAGNDIYNNYFDTDNNAEIGPVQSMPCSLSNSNTWNTTIQPGANIVGGPNLGGNYWGSFSRNCQDSDGDYICDSSYNLFYTGNVDNYPLKDFPDPDGDGVPDPDDNCPSIPNPLQENSDSDAVGNACDNCWYTDNTNQADTNGSCPAMPFTVDPFCGDACEPSDTDADGVIDDNDNCPLTPNPLQEDNDEDARGDACDNCVDISNPDQNDSDSDGTGNVCDNCRYVQNPDQADADGDCSAYNQPYLNDPFCGSACEECPDDPDKQYQGRCGCGVNDAVADPDGDGVCGASDQCPDDPNKIEPGICGCGVPDIDDDNDGYLSCNDNCPDIRNDQTDTDSDGLGDVCDNCLNVPNADDQGDSDGDGVGDVCDNCPDTPNGQSPISGVCSAGEIGKICSSNIDCGPFGIGSCTPAARRGTCVEGNIGRICSANGACGAGGVCSLDQEDADGDGAGDACETDDDNDGVLDIDDNCRTVYNPGQEDADGDGIADACNDAIDTDGDEWANDLDNCPKLFNPAQLDNNNNATGDACEFDLTISGVEVTQGIQGLNNSVPLITEKDTLVRAYIDIGSITINTVAPVTGTLRFVDSNHNPIGTYGPGAPAGFVYPNILNLTVKKNPPLPAREDYIYNLNFMIPKEWYWFETPYLEISVINQSGDEEINELNNTSYYGPLVFQSVYPLNVKFTPVTVPVNGCGMPTMNDFWQSARWLSKVYPVNKINVWEWSPLNFDKDPTEKVAIWPSDEKIAVSGGQLWLQLWLRKLFDTDKPPVTVHFGQVCHAQQPLLANDTSGMGLDGVAWALKDGYKMAHEIGHARGLLHPADVCSDDPRDANYPNSSGLIDDIGVDPMSFDDEALVIYTPNTDYDFMSYCGSPYYGEGNRWVSKYMYNKLADSFISPIQSGASIQAVKSLQAEAIGEQEYLVATGTIITDDTVKLEKFRRMMFPIGTNDGQGTGPYSLELQSESGAILFVRNFELKIIHKAQVFSEIIPFHPETALILLKQADVGLEKIILSANNPVVTVTYPNGGESLVGEQIITWKAADADDDALTFDILYSWDGGNNWSALATGQDQNSYVWNTDRSPGGNKSLIRVLATDGVNTGQDNSDEPFTVAKKIPEIIIFSPEDHTSFFLNDWIFFEGNGYDFEDGPLGDNALSWLSSINGIIGSGTDISINNLSPGEHNITLIAEDSDRNSTKASITIRVSSVKDSDGDGIGDDADNCPFIHSIDQSDLDGDGVGDVCDNDDIDSDGYPDIRDNCILIPNDQADVDGDGIGNVCDEFNYHLYDSNPADWIIGDFELLDAIDAWAAGNLGDFELLDLIDYWAVGCYQWDASSSTHKAGC